MPCYHIARKPYAYSQQNINKRVHPLTPPTFSAILDKGEVSLPNLYPVSLSIKISMAVMRFSIAAVRLIWLSDTFVTLPLFFCLLIFFTSFPCFIIHYKTAPGGLFFAPIKKHPISRMPLFSIFNFFHLTGSIFSRYTKSPPHKTQSLKSYPLSATNPFSHLRHYFLLTTSKQKIIFISRGGFPPPFLISALLSVRYRLL